MKLERLIKTFRRWWARITQPGTGGLIQPGDWRCIYSDGLCSRWMSYGDADNLCEIFGGRLQWRGDIQNNEER